MRWVVSPLIGNETQRSARTLLRYVCNHPSIHTVCLYHSYVIIVRQTLRKVVISFPENDRVIVNKRGIMEIEHVRH